MYDFKRIHEHKRKSKFQTGKFNEHVIFAVINVFVNQYSRVFFHNILFFVNIHALKINENSIDQKIYVSTILYVALAKTFYETCYLRKSM